MHRFPRTLLVFCAISIVAASAAAQIRPGDCGITVATKSGGSAGNLCRGFTCTPYPLTALQQERVEIALRGPAQAPYWLFAAPAVPLCLPLPGFMNSLVMAPPFFPLVGGTLNLPDRILACPGGLAELSFALPPHLPKGFQLHMQALVMAVWLPGPLPTFTPAVTVTVQ